MNEVHKLANLLTTKYGRLKGQRPPRCTWPKNSALSVLDCVLSLNRKYETFARPRVLAFSQLHPEVVELAHLEKLLSKYRQVGDFFREKLNYKHPQREQTFRGVVAYLLTVQAQHKGVSEWMRLQKWAAVVRPEDYRVVGVRGFGLAGFQYMRMLLGIQTAKPDIYIIQFVSDAVKRKVSNVKALTLLAAAAKKAGLPLREVDRAIWDELSKTLVLAAAEDCPSRQTRHCS